VNAPASPPVAKAQLQAFATDIKLSHTIFALPFALAAAWIVHQATPVGLLQWMWILVAMVGARSSAMGFNRIVDRRIDQANPRTEGRQLAAGHLDLRWAWGLTLGSAGLLVLAAWMLSPEAFYASPFVLLVLWGYSLTKRFTALCHIWLGFALGLSPTCVWLALTGTVTPTPAVMGLAILAWVGGFDTLYALQDRAYDQEVGLNSIPARLGEVGALRVSGALHGMAVAALLALPLTTPLGWPYFVAVAVVAGILAWEQSLVQPGDLSKMNAAFFQANAWVSVVMAVGIVAATLVEPVVLGG
jgi:4-hydroxybenzoate polyprenyltransferase